jgi:hypothetical protein
MQAALDPRAEDKLSGRQIAERIAAAFPAAVIDWQRGDQAVQKMIDDWTGSSVPELILASMRQRFGQVAHITVTFSEWPDHTASLCEYQVERELGEAIHLVTLPQNLAFIHHAAGAIGEALDCDYLLLAKGCGIECRTTRGGVNDALAFARQQFAENAYPGLQVKELTDWAASVRAAVMDYFVWIYWPPLVEKILEGFASAEAYADAVVAELAEIGPVRRIWLIKSDAPHQYDLLLDHGEWTTLLEMAVRGMGAIGNKA